MAGAQMAVDKTCAVAEQNHRQIVMRDIEFDLFDCADWYECGQTVYKWSESDSGKTGGHPHHILLCDTGVNILCRAFSTEIVKQRVTMISCR